MNLNDFIRYYNILCCEKVDIFSLGKPSGNTFKKTNISYFESFNLIFDD